MNIRNKDIVGCFPLLASVLGNKYGVEIRIGGESAKTDGKIVYLPAMPPELDDDTLESAKGFVDHESAHVRYTDFTELKRANLGKLEQWLFNAIEDWRVEQLLAEKYPGCGQNFQKLIRKVFGTPTEAGHKNPAFVVLDYVLFSVRAWAVPDISDNQKQTGKILDENFIGLTDDLDNLLGQIRLNCLSTKAAIAHARQLADCIRKYVNQPQAEDNEVPPPQSTSAENPAEPGAPDEQNSGDNAGSRAEQATESGAGTEQTNCDSQSHYDTQQDRESEKTSREAGPTADDGEEDNPADQPDDTPGQGQTADLDALLEENDEDTPQNLGQILANRLDACATSENEEGVAVATIKRKAISSFSAEEKTEALRDSAAMRQRLAGLLQARSLRLCVIGRHGKLDSSCLHRICVGNTRVFRREAEKIAMNAAVHILLDCSYSMQGASMVMARKACYAIVKSLANTRGINLALTVFPADGYDGPTVFPVIRHGQTAKEIPSLSADGDTPLGPALWWVMRDMLPLQESRKIILILTDGIPNSVNAAERAISQCQKLGMEVMGIGIMSTAIADLLPKSSKVIWWLGELAPAIFELMQTALLRGGQK